MAEAVKDDLSTLAALGVIAFAIVDSSHEALGHGLATLAAGGKVDLLTSCLVISSGQYSKWIPAAGGLANLFVGICSISLLRLSSSGNATWRYFLVLLSAFNLFFAFGYPAYSGIAHFGDWAAVISGLHPEWLWPALLILTSVAGYYGTMRLLVRPLVPFAWWPDEITKLTDRRRLARLTNIPYFAAILLAGMAAALNPKGWPVIFTSGIPAAAAAFGLTQMDHLVEMKCGLRTSKAAQAIVRNPLLIAAAVVIAILFVGILGSGVRPA